jgi:hypothetical protein
MARCEVASGCRSAAHDGRRASRRGTRLDVTSGVAGACGSLHEAAVVHAKDGPARRSFFGDRLEQGATSVSHRGWDARRFHNGRMVKCSKTDFVHRDPDAHLGRRQHVQLCAQALEEPVNTLQCHLAR